MIFGNPFGLWNFNFREGSFPALLSTYVIYWDWSTQCSQLSVILHPCSPLMLTHFLPILWQFSFLFVLNSEFRRIFDILFYFWISTYSFLIHIQNDCKWKSRLTVVVVAGTGRSCGPWRVTPASPAPRSPSSLSIQYSTVQYSTVHCITGHHPHHLGRGHPPRRAPRSGL